MKKIFSFTVMAIAAISLTVSSCGKYEDGPGMSLRSKKARLAGEWTASKFFENGTDVTSQALPSGSSYKMTINKDGSWTSTVTFGSFSGTETGTWEFVDGKEKLKVVTTGSTDTDGDTSTITMLKNKELHIKSVYGTNTSEVYFVQ